VRLQQGYQWGGIQIGHAKAYPDMCLLEIVVESICLLNSPRRWTALHIQNWRRPASKQPSETEFRSHSVQVRLDAIDWLDIASLAPRRLIAAARNTPDPRLARSNFITENGHGLSTKQTRHEAEALLATMR
jgi:hypothetical protein